MRNITRTSILYLTYVKFRAYNRCDFVFQIQALRLLRTVLPSWEAQSDGVRATSLVEKLFTTLGNVLLTCNDDPTLSALGITRISNKDTQLNVAIPSPLLVRL